MSRSVLVDGFKRFASIPALTAMLTPYMNTSANTAAQGLWLIGCGSGFIVQEGLLCGDDTIEEVVVLSHHVLHLWIITRPPLSSKSVNYDAQLYLSER